MLSDCPSTLHLLRCSIARLGTGYEVRILVLCRHVALACTNKPDVGIYPEKSSLVEYLRCQVGELLVETRTSGDLLDPSVVWALWGPAFASEQWSLSQYEATHGSESHKTID